MVDSDYKYHPTETETRQKPKWIPIKEMLHIGTIGYSLALNSDIPNFLERERPENIFQQDVFVLWGRGSNALNVLQENNITTVTQLLDLKPEEIFSLDCSDDIYNHLSTFLQNYVAILPHVRLLRNVTGLPPQVIPFSREKELKDAVDNAVLQLPPEEQYLLEISFGLQTGVTLTQGQISEKLSISKVNIRDKERKATRTLSKLLANYSLLHPNSFGQEMLKAVFMKDLPPIEEYDIFDLDLPDTTKEELERKWFIKDYYYNLKFILTKNSEELSLESRKTIQSAFHDFFEKHLPQLNNQVNNLLPEVEISQEKLAALADIPIGILDLNAHSYNALARNCILTIGQLLRISKERFRKIPKNGAKAGLSEAEILKITKELERLLDLSEETINFL